MGKRERKKRKDLAESERARETERTVGEGGKTRVTNKRGSA
jgi:hypothetical protein